MAPNGAPSPCLVSFTRIFGISADTSICGKGNAEPELGVGAAAPAEEVLDKEEEPAAAATVGVIGWGGVCGDDGSSGNAGRGDPTDADAVRLSVAPPLSPLSPPPTLKGVVEAAAAADTNATSSADSSDEVKIIVGVWALSLGCAGVPVGLKGLPSSDTAH